MEYLSYYLLFSSFCFFVAWRLEDPQDLTFFSWLLIYFAGPFILGVQACARRKDITARILRTKVPEKLRFKWK